MIVICNTLFCKFVYVSTLLHIWPSGDTETEEYIMSRELPLALSVIVREWFPLCAVHCVNGAMLLFGVTCTVMFLTHDS